MVCLQEAFETEKMFMLKFDTLPGTDVLSYLAERDTYSETIVAEIANQVIHFFKKKFSKSKFLFENKIIRKWNIFLLCTPH